MPAPRAYAETEVIARGLALESTGTVSLTSLHQSLGGRGDRNTAFATWTAFLEHRDRLGPPKAPAHADGLSPAVSALFTEMINKMVEVAKVSAAERDAVHDRRAGHNLAAMDALLARNEQLGAEAAALRSEIDRLTAALAATPGGGRLGRLILPS